MIKMLKNFWKEEEGQDLIEYALMLTLILLTSVTAITTIGTNVGAIFTAVSGKVVAPS